MQPLQRTKSRSQRQRTAAGSAVAPAVEHGRRGGRVGGGGDQGGEVGVGAGVEQRLKRNEAVGAARTARAMGVRAVLGDGDWSPNAEHGRRAPCAALRDELNRGGEVGFGQHAGCRRGSYANLIAVISSSAWVHRSWQETHTRTGS